MLPLMGVVSGITTIAIAFIVFGMPMLVLIVLAFGIVGGSSSSETDEDVAELKDRVEKLESAVAVEHDDDNADEGSESDRA